MWRQTWIPRAALAVKLLRDFNENLFKLAHDMALMEKGDRLKLEELNMTTKWWWKEMRRRRDEIEVNG